MTQRERQVLQLIEADPLISQQDIAAKLGITRSSVAVHIANLTKKGCIAGRGYVLHAGTYAVVVGGVNVDIGGRSLRFQPRQSKRESRRRRAKHCPQPEPHGHRCENAHRLRRRSPR